MTTTPNIPPSAAGKPASTLTRQTTQTTPAPFLKWVGSKRRLLPQLLPLLPRGHRLIEPFVGAGSVFMGSSYPQYLLADTNAVLMTLYAQLQREPQAVMVASQALFVDANRSLEAYNALRARFNDPATPEVERAALFVYFNKFAFNGLYRLNRCGQMNVPYAHHVKLPGFPQAAMVQFARKLANPGAGAPVQVLCTGFEETMAQAKAGDVVYCDPPYLPMAHGRACFTAYGAQSFGLVAHQRLADLAHDLSSRGIPVVISNHDSPTTRALYAGARLHSVQAHRSLAASQSARGTVSELVAVFGGA
jgi:DNA adenine methylase